MSEWRDPFWVEASRLTRVKHVIVTFWRWRQFSQFLGQWLAFEDEQARTKR